MNLAPDTYSALADVSVAFAPAPAAGLDDTGLVEAQRTLAEIRRRVDASAAVVAAEIRHRSRRELGYDGLAQRLGARTPELLVQQVTGFTGREAQTLVRVGSLMTPAAPVLPWLTAVATAVSAGRLSIEAADAIRAGLGAPSDDITADALAAAAATLLHEAPQLTVERLAARARELRSELDLDHVLDHEQRMRDRRFLQLMPQSDGMTRIHGLLDPESAAIIGTAYDSATSPRRGGPRFVDPTTARRAQDLVDDERTTEQIAVDAFVELIRIGGLVDGETVLLGSRRPAVQLLVTERDLNRRGGICHIESHPQVVSIETAQRLACDVGIVPVLFDSRGAVIDLGRTQRRFSQSQRLALAARDGGCMFPGCDRPPSWTEAHHINEWHRDHGKTDLADGILLCRHHHLLVHNNGWRICREGAEYFLIPPRSIDPEQRPIPMPSKSTAAARLRREVNENVQGPTTEKAGRELVGAAT